MRDRLGSVASTFLVGGSGFSGACVTQLSATAATAMLRGGSGRQTAVILQHQKPSKREREANRQGKKKRGREQWKGAETWCASFILINKNRFVALDLSGFGI